MRPIVAMLRLVCQEHGGRLCVFFDEQEDRRPTHVIPDHDDRLMTKRIVFSRSSRLTNWMFPISCTPMMPCPLRLQKFRAAAAPALHVEQRSYAGPQNPPRLGPAGLILNPVPVPPGRGSTGIPAAVSLIGRFTACRKKQSPVRRVDDIGADVRRRSDVSS